MAKKFKMVGLRGLSFMPTLIVLGLMIFFYSMYMQTFLLPMIKQQNSFPKGLHTFRDPASIKWNRGAVYFIITHVLSILFLVSYIMVVVTPPGSIPDEWNKMKMDQLIEEYIRSKKENNKGLFSNLLTKSMMANININDKDFKEFLNNSGQRFCDYCKKLKPERTHHCRQCGICVLKMDHHCNWLYNCIGFNNYKIFLVFLLYTNSILIFIFVTYSECLTHYYLDSKVSNLKFFLISLCFFMNATFVAIIFSFTSFHIFYLASANKTTLEFCESQNNKNDFGNGLIYNWFDICGPNPLCWFLPFCRGKGDGVSFSNQYETDDEMFNLVLKQ